jgi:hypothetical protein
MSPTNETQSEIATAPADRREPVEPALPRNPLVTLAVAFLTPVAGLLRRRCVPAAASVRKMKVESYSYNRVPTGSRLPRSVPEGTPKDVRRISEGTFGDSERRSTGAKPTTSGKGGHHHGQA